MLLTLMFVAHLARAAASHAVLPPVLPPGDLAFGLDKLKWGMTAREARKKYPSLDGPDAEPGQLSATLSLRNYAIAGCRFTVSLDFALGRLDQVDLDSDGTAGLKACSDAIKPALIRQYGGEPGGFSPAQNPHGYSEYAAWGGPVTEIVYAELKGGFITMHFSTPGHR
jgi:hypothetical protein